MPLTGQYFTFFLCFFSFYYNQLHGFSPRPAAAIAYPGLLENNREFNIFKPWSLAIVKQIYVPPTDLIRFLQLEKYRWSYLE